MRENEEAGCYRPAMDCSIYDGLTMVLADLSFICSSPLPRAWQLRGIYGESKYTYIGLNAG